MIVFWLVTRYEFNDWIIFMFYEIGLIALNHNIDFVWTQYHKIKTKMKKWPPKSLESRFLNKLMLLHIKINRAIKLNTWFKNPSSHFL